MAAVEITISGLLYDKLNRTTQNVVLIGEATLTGLSVGGGPIYPPDGGVKPPDPFPGRPTFPIWGPPGSNFPDKPGYPPVVGGGPIIPDPPPIIPPDQLPDAPPPGSPTTPLPPPAGAAGWPVQPIVPPPFIIVNYPGIGPVVVAPPAQGAVPPDQQPPS